ncbi:MAG: translation elongation factor Ts [Holosporales bacterium]|jgi:elongation factor Ts|nr:translation elongation factor Ts [Holosporales bacterium]
MEIGAALVKQLRDKTGAGMMDCKRALLENNGDITIAEEYLRKKGLMDAAKKSSRAAAEGLVAVTVSGDRKTASIVEVNSETDFVARNEKFQELVREIVSIATTTDDIVNARTSNGKAVKEEIDSLISLVGENLTFRRSKKINVDRGIISTYVHSSICPGMGKIGVLVAMEAPQELDVNTIDEFGRKVAMHIAAANPSYLCQGSVPSEVVAKEKEIAIAQAIETGKPQAIAEKIAEGRVKKFYEESVLLDQVFVIDGKAKVSDAVGAFGKDHGCDVKIVDFVKFVLGEGIEKAETNFADEVAAFMAPHS